MGQTKAKWRAGQLAFYDGSTFETVEPMSPVVMYDDFLGAVVNTDFWTEVETNAATKAMAASALTYTIAANVEIEDAGIYGNNVPADGNRFFASAAMQLGAYAILKTDFPGAGVGYITCESTQVGGFDDTMGHLDVAGFDPYGVAAVDVITPINGSTVSGTQLFRTITSITGDGWIRDAGAGSEDTIVLGSSTVVTPFRLDKGLIFEARVKITTDPTDQVELMFGLTGKTYSTDNQVAEADDIPIHAFFVFDGAATCTIYTDDGTEDNDAVATGYSADAAYHIYRIDATETDDVKFYIDGAHVASGTTFDMSPDADHLEMSPYCVAVKAGGAGVCVYVVDYIRVWQATR